jgi:hypothetical protein
MPRTAKYKYDDNYQVVKTSGKIFIYLSPQWNTLYPIVEFIKVLEPKTIIGYKYGKNQQIIKNYSSHYNQMVIGYSLDNKEDYLNKIVKGKVSYIIIFNNSLDDPVTKNLVGMSYSFKINLVTYSLNESTYQLKYYPSEGVPEKMSFGNPSGLAKKMKELKESEMLLPWKNTFPEYHLEQIQIVSEEDPLKKITDGALNDCIEKIKSVTEYEQSKKESSKIKFYDPAMNILRKHQYTIKKENEPIAEKLIPEKPIPEKQSSKKLSITNFFKKLN